MKSYLCSFINVQVGSFLPSNVSYTNIQFEAM